MENSISKVDYKKMNKNEKLKNKLLKMDISNLDSKFDENFLNTLSKVKADLLEGDATSFDALMKIRRLINRGDLIPQADIDLALSVELKNWKGADVRGRKFPELRFFDFSDAKTDYLQVFGDVQKSVFKEIKGFNTHGGNIYMNKVENGDITGCTTNGGNINKNKLEDGDISNNSLGRGNIKDNKLKLGDISNNTGAKKIKGNELPAGFEVKNND